MRAIVHLALTLALAALTGCGQALPMTLPDAVHREIPVYAPATSYSTTSLLIPGEGTLVQSGSTERVIYNKDLTHHGVTWHMQSVDSPEKIIAFYDKAMPAGWTREAEKEKTVVGAKDGPAKHRFFYKPGDAADEIERVIVDVFEAQRDGQTLFDISEYVPRSKRDMK